MIVKEARIRKEECDIEKKLGMCTLASFSLPTHEINRFLKRFFGFCKLTNICQLKMLSVQLVSNKEKSKKLS